MKDKNDVFHDNKKRIEQAWDLIKIAGQLISDVVDVTDSTLDSAHELYLKTLEIDEDLYPLYELNKDLHHES